jgi:hypothetical protein
VAAGTQAAPALPSARTVLRRALFIWGLGHLALGDRRGLLLLVAQPLAIAAWLLVAVQLLGGESWLILFPALLALVAIHIAQAVDAQRRALALGAAPGGELQMAWLMAAIALVVAAFWLAAGDHASPEATLAEYVAAWQADDADAGVVLLAGDALTGGELAAAWHEQRDYIGERVAAALASYGAASGLDAAAPFNSLRFSLASPPAAARTATVAIDIIRFERVETHLFGFIPTASREIVAVERVGIIRLGTYPAQQPDWLRLSLPPALQLASGEWRIELIGIPPAAT